MNPIPDRYDFLSTINNKTIEYMSAGLPVLSSPKKGVLYRLLKTEEVRDRLLSRVIRPICHGPSSGCTTIPVGLKTWSENAKSVFEWHFDAEIVYKDMARYLGNIANRFRERKEGPGEILRHV